MSGCPGSVSGTVITQKLFCDLRTKNRRYAFMESVWGKRKSKTYMTLQALETIRSCDLIVLPAGTFYAYRIVWSRFVRKLRILPLLACISDDQRCAETGTGTQTDSRCHGRLSPTRGESPDVRERHVYPFRWSDIRCLVLLFSAPGQLCSAAYAVGGIGITDFRARNGCIPVLPASGVFPLPPPADGVSVASWRG